MILKEIKISFLHVYAISAKMAVLCRGMTYLTTYSWT